MNFTALPVEMPHHSLWSQALLEVFHMPSSVGPLPPLLEETLLRRIYELQETHSQECTALKVRHS